MQIYSKPTKVRRLARHVKNLAIVEIDKQTYVRSYQTLVAKVCGTELVQQDYWSRTTQRHITYAARALGLRLIRLDNHKN